MAAGSLLVTEAGGLIGNFTGEADFMDHGECVAGNPRIYGQLVTTVGKYSKFAGAGDKANVRQAILDATAAETPSQTLSVSKSSRVTKTATNTPSTDAGPAETI